jgi:hypothetical protein
MLVRLKRVLVLALGLTCIGGVQVSADHIRWGQRWELTPVEHKRLRAKGLSDEEVYQVSTLAMKTHYDVDWLVNAMFRGVAITSQATQMGLATDILKAERPAEWGSPGWEEAVQRGDPFWYTPTAPRTSGGMAAPR